MTTKIKPPFVRNPYNYDMNEAGDESGLSCPEPTLAKQEFQEESDINFIAEKFGLTGEMPTVVQVPQYGDFTGIFDFQTAQHAVIEGQKQFMSLPAKVRSRFDNDPQKLLEFMASPDNRDEAIGLGLIKPPPRRANETGTTEIPAANAQDRSPDPRAAPSTPASRADGQPRPKAGEDD